MADKYPNAPYPNYNYGGGPSAPPQAQGMPYPQYYPPPSYDAAIKGQQMYPQPPYGQQQPGMMPQAPPQQMYPGNNGFGGFQPMPQPQYYPPMPPGAMPYAQGPGPMPPHHPAPPPQPHHHGGGGVAPVTAVFDAGARFHNGPVTVPPPPPGYMPTPAQSAAMNGQSVHVQKDKNGFFTGGKGAGFTFW